MNKKEKEEKASAPQWKKESTAMLKSTGMFPNSQGESQHGCKAWLAPCQKRHGTCCIAQ